MDGGGCVCECVSLLNAGSPDSFSSKTGTRGSGVLMHAGQLLNQFGKARSQQSSQELSDGGGCV